MNFICRNRTNVLGTYSVEKIHNNKDNSTMIHFCATPETNQHGCLSLSRECKLERKMRAAACGAFVGYCVSFVTICSAGLAKKLLLGVSCCYCGLGAAAGAAVFCTGSSFVCHKCTPQSTDNHIPRRNVPITTESSCLPSTPAIVQQPEGRAPQTIGDGCEPTAFDPPPYSTVVQMGYPPPSYQEVCGERV